MNPSDAATLLTICAAYDQRTIGEADVLAWHEALDCPWVPNISLDEAHAAVIDHYRRTSQRIAPADVIKHVRDDRTNVMRGTAPPHHAGVPATEEYLAARKVLEEALARRSAALSLDDEMPKWQPGMDKQQLALAQVEASRHRRTVSGGL